MEALIKNPLIGADIEVFLRDKETGEIVSAEGYVQGSKHAPFNFDPSHRYFILSLDNVAAEFGIPPVTDREAFKAYIQRGLDYINQTIPDRYCTASLPAAVLDKKYLQTKNAKLFGCEPDYNVWLKDVNPRPVATNASLRSCGGHIHIGYDEPTMELNEALIKAMDLHVGVPSVLQEPDNERKTLYGKAGCFRWKDYGVEYRTISNYYAGDERLTDWVYNATQNAIQAVNQGFEFDYFADRIQDAINNNNKVVAQTLINELQLELA